MMIETVSIIAGILAVIAMVMTNYKLRCCFVVWFVFNGIAAFVHVYSSLFVMAGLDIIFISLAVHGWWMWGKIAAVEAAKGE